MGLVTDAEKWMDMLKSRNDTSHTYNSETAIEIYNKVVSDYQPLFNAFEKKWNRFAQVHNREFLTKKYDLRTKG